MSLPYAEQPALVEPRIFGFCCRVTNAMKVVAVIEMIWLSLVISACLFSLTSGRYSSIVGLLFAILGMVAAVKLFRAVDQVVPQSVNLYLGWKYTQMVFAIIAAGVLIYALTLPNEYVFFQYLLISFLVYTGVLLVSGVVFLAIVHKAKEYLTQMVFLTPMPGTIQGQAPQSYVPAAIQVPAPPPYAHYRSTY